MVFFNVLQYREKKLIREFFEDREKELLMEWASMSCYSKGRIIAEAKCDIRTDFQRDRDRILHSKSFRRLKHKTQVFLGPDGDHYRTRLTHTLEVSQIARTIARALRLNEDLTEAIALGHDLGHTPFGHAGERALADIGFKNFKHNVQSIRVVEKIENQGKGLNLTFEVKDGILNHKTSGRPQTLEGKIVQLSDKIAYVNHDIDDGIRAGIISNENLPRDLTEILGYTTRDRINKLIHALVDNSIENPVVELPEKEKYALKKLREYMEF